jgi:hypothetical protein
MSRIAIIVASVVLAVLVAGCAPSQAEINATVQAAVAATQTAQPTNTPTAIIPRPTRTPTPGPRYQVIEQRDVGSGSVVQLSIKATIPRGTSLGEMKRVCMDIANNRITTPFNAITFFLYWEGTDTNGTFSAAKVVWAPDGDWTKAGEMTAGDYLRHLLVVEETKPEPPVATPTRPSLHYQLVEKRDVSTGSAVRLSIKATIPRGTSLDEMKQICMDIVENRITGLYNAVALFLYWEGTDTNGAFSAARAVWAPNGDWEKAGEVAVGDYSRHRLVIEETRPEPPAGTPSVGLPEETRKKIYWDLVVAQDQGYEGEAAYPVVAKKYGVPEETVRKIAIEGTEKMWPIPPAPN